MSAVVPGGRRALLKSQVNRAQALLVSVQHDPF